MLTTVNTPDIVNTSTKHYATGELIRKPECVVSYAKNMGLWINRICKLV